MPLAQKVLWILTGISDLVLTDNKTQYDLKHLLGARSICLDVLASDSKGTIYDLEIQRADRGASPKRARYHSSIKDAHLLKPGDDFDRLPESYVIFITESDVMKGGLPLYQIERIVTNNGEPFNDGEHIIYVNGEDKNSATELGKLMHDFYCTDPDDMHYKQLADKVRYFKENEEGVRSMCATLEKMRDETAKKAAEQATEQTKIQMALKMIKDGELSLDKIANYTSLAIDKVKELATLRPV